MKQWTKPGEIPTFRMAEVAASKDTWGEPSNLGSTMLGLGRYHRLYSTIEWCALASVRFERAPE